MTAALYIGSVMHRRLVKPRLHFRYRHFALLLDIDQLDRDLSATRLLSRNRFNLFSFHDRDHGPRDGSPLRPWIDRILRGAGIHLQGGSVRLLCMPRTLGYGFNPLSSWYCHHADGSLRAVLCEVRNTFGEHHGYLLHQRGEPLAATVRSAANKQFHVSPFFPVQGRYEFSIQPPADRVRIGIRLISNETVQLLAGQHGRHRPLNDRELLRLALRQPFSSLKVIASIHWQALKLWLRGARYHSKPQPPQQEIS
ncbi:DUF1365 domain-containing protein [Methylonatrum kenyense]|uniref:DUF1365 domain-containing protein n=1 Tax=Methylonatrum kenyense TaxID=455253 RepID=UPI0020C01EB2|nr:DUF1365 domain-containing protein [Methylonatrum kenyense]